VSVGKSALYRLCAVCVLLLGLGCAVSVYLSAPDDPAGNAGYITEGGEVYSVRPEDSRSYLRSLEYIGGKSAVFMMEFRERIAGFWNAGTLAVLVVVAAAGAAVLLLRAADRAERGCSSKPGSAPPDE